jgi:hypothetical protein
MDKQFIKAVVAVYVATWIIGAALVQFVHIASTFAKSIHSTIPSTDEQSTEHVDSFSAGVVCADTVISDTFRNLQPYTHPHWEGLNQLTVKQLKVIARVPKSKRLTKFQLQSLIIAA